MNILKKALNKFFYSKKTKMEQEIFEQPDVIFELIRKYITKNYKINVDIPENIDEVILIASGSSFHSAYITADFIRTIIHLNARAFYASEISLAEKFDIKENTLYIFISQSGETSDTNYTLNKISQKTDKILGITNVKNSRLWNNSKYKVLTYAGAEKSIASTKTMSAQLFCLLLTAIKIMEIKKIPAMKYIEALLNVPENIKDVLLNRQQINKQAQKLSNYENAVVLASGLFYALAKEGALKLKETSYIHTSAYPTGEFSHGHIAVLNKKCFVIVLVNEQNIQLTIDLLNKINKKYNPQILIVTSSTINDNDDFIKINSKNDIEFLFSALTVFQLLSLETAIILNRNVDNPDGLTKVVK